MASIVTGLIEQVKIDAGANQSIASTAYGVCNTLSDQAAKTVEMTGFKLITGVTVHIKFTYSNAAENPPTLNINNTGAKSIVQYGTTSAGTNAETNGWRAGAVLSLTYDGTSWVRDQGYNTNTNTWRGIQDNLTSDSAIDSLSAKQGKALKGLIDAMDATTPNASGNATAFIDSITQTDGKITSITKKNIPTVSKDTAGLAPKGAAVSTQDTSTKFLREDGTWATPSYTTNTDEKVSQIGSADDKNFPIILKNTENTDETSGVKYSNNINTDVTKTKPFTFNPSTGTLTVSRIKIGTKDDNMGLFPNLNNWNQIGSSSLYWYRAYINNYYGTSSHITNWDAGKNIGTAATNSAAAVLGSVNFYNTAAAGATQTKTLLTADSTANSNITITLPKTTGTLALVGDNSHTHSYLPLSGGTLTGTLTLSNNVGLNFKDAANNSDTFISFTDADNTTVKLGIRRPLTTYGLTYYDGTNYKLIAHAGNIVNNNINLSRNTETTIATIAGVAIKIKLPASDNTNTASAVDNILDGSNSGTAITYAPYSSQQSKLSFDTSSTAPNRTDRLNLNGYLYATKLYSGGTEVSVSGHNHSYAGSSSAGGAATTAITTTNTTDEIYILGVKSGATTTLLHDTKITATGGKLMLTGGGLEIKGHIAGDGGTTGHGLYSGGVYHNAYNNIILHGDATYGTSGIAFVSDKVAADGTVTTINQPSDRAFIQYHAYGVTTATAEGTAPTLATSGEAGRLVIGIGNDASGDKIVLQAPGDTDIIHQKGATGYPIPHTTNTNGSVGGTTTPVYVDAGVIKAGTALKNLAYKDSLAAADIPNLSWNKITSDKPTTIGGYGITDAKIASGVITLGSNTITPVTSVNGYTGSSVSITAADLGLSKAMHFIGVATVAITDGSTTDPAISGYSTKTAGDVIIDKDSSREYVWSTTGNWELLGGDSSYKVTQSTVDSGAAATNKWVSRIQQNTNGLVTITMGTLDTSGTWNGNAAMATKLQTARSLWGNNFDGTAAISGNITISHATNATMTADSTNPKITFSENGAQPVHLIYTDYDGYRSPAGLKVIGGASATPAWFEVEGNIYAAAFKGNADTATSAGKWTTARTFTIGNTGKSVDGSGNVSWSLADIGAAASAHEHNRLNGIGRLGTAAAIAYNPGASQGFRLVWNIYDSSSRANDATNSPSFDAGVINIPWDWGGFNGQIAISNTVKDNTRMQIRSASSIDNGESANPRYTPNYGAWREVVTATKATQMGSATKPIYISNTGQVIEGTALGGAAYKAADYYAVANHGTHVPASGTTGQFLRGDNTWSNTISGGLFKITNNSNTVTIGSANTSWCHFENSANIPFYFNHQINAVDGFKVYNTATSLTNNNLTFSQGGGWYMADTTWIRTVGSKSVYMNTGTFRNDGTTQLRTLQHVNANIVDDGSWVTGTTGTNGDGTNAGATGTSILTIGNGTAVTKTNGAGGNNSRGYLRIYSDGTGYGELIGYGSWIHANSGLSIPENKIGIMFRPGSSSYYTHISYQTTGNEALVAATQNTVTSFIFINGESYANVASNRWTQLTGASGAGSAPGLQIKQNCVSIGELIPNGTNATYKLNVNGTTNIKDTLYANYYASSSSITSRITSINFTGHGNAGAGRTKMRLDLVTTSCTTGSPPIPKTNGNSSGYLHTYYWDSNDAAMTQIYIPNGDHITSTNGPQCLYMRGYDSGWKDWVAIPTGTGTGASGTWGISITGSSASCTGNAATATTWQTSRTLTIGNKGQSVNGGSNVSWALQDVLIRAGNEFNYTADGIAGLWFNYRTQTGTSATTKITEYNFGNGQGSVTGVTLKAAAFSGNAATATAIQTAGTTAQFYRGDNSWSDTISGGTLKITNNSNTVTIGSLNTSFTHIYNSANIPFIFNKDVLTADSHNLGSVSWPWGNLYIGAKGSRSIYYVGTNATNAMITFLDNTGDSYGNGIKIGGGGAVVVGAGESAGNLSVTAGTETLYLVSDGVINIEAGGDTIANRIGFQITAAGHIVPVKAEAANNNAQNLGASDNKWANVYATNFVGNASTATKATQDSDGNAINSTYLKLSGGTMTGTLTALHISCATYTAGNTCNINGSALEIREVGRVGTAQSDWTYAPKIGFHWSGRVALQLGMNSSQHLCLFNNNSDSSYGTFKAGAVYGAVWNDYAEMRNVPEAQQLLKTKASIVNYQLQKRDVPLAGRCVYEVGDDTMKISNQRLLRGCRIISDTFGFNIGETDDAKTPVAVSGRVLVYLYEDREFAREYIGYPVCSGPNGTVSLMTEEEEKLYPYAIIGTISAVPDYEIWGEEDVPVNGRIWIYVK